MRYISHTTSVSQLRQVNTRLGAKMEDQDEARRLLIQQLQATTTDMQQEMGSRMALEATQANLRDQVQNLEAHLQSAKHEVCVAPQTLTHSAPQKTGWVYRTSPHEGFSILDPIFCCLQVDCFRHSFTWIRVQLGSSAQLLNFMEILLGCLFTASPLHMPNARTQVRYFCLLHPTKSYNASFHTMQFCMAELMFSPHPPI